MKKHTFKTLTAIALLLCIFSGLTTVTAFADFVGNYSVGQEIQNVLVYSSNETLTAVSAAAGNLPAGVNLGWTSDGVYLYGTPSTVGSYTSTYIVSKGTVTESFSLSITIANPVNDTPVLATVAPNNAAQNSGTPVITKHPTGETVDVGGTAKFVAKADFCNSIIWRLVSEDTTVTYPAADAPAYFPGLTVEGIGTERLVLNGIPAALDGWCVEAKFIGSSGTVYSNGARIRVRGAAPVPTPAPTAEPAPQTPGAPQTTVGAQNDPSMKTANITIQPYSANKTLGEEYTLSLMATSPNNGDLSYQWYVSDTNSRLGAAEISGANTNSYTVPQAEGRKYYYCAIWNTKEGRVSDAKYSDIVSVLYSPVATPTPAPTPTPEPTPNKSTGTNELNSQLIIFSVLGVIALLALVGVLVYLRMASEKLEDDDELELVEKPKAKKKRK